MRDIASEATRKMCDRAAETGEDLAKARTPFKTGKLREGWVRKGAVADGEGFRASIENSVSYAASQESGSGLYGPRHAKYLIQPHKPGGVLRWVGRDGQVHFARHVWHPGVKPRWFLATAMDLTAAALEDGALVRDILEDWAKSSEAAIDKQA